MTKQEIAKYISEINWQNIQNDVPKDNVELIYLQEALDTLSKEDIMEILFAVIEANSLSKISPNFFGDLLKFNHINNK